MKKAFCLGVFLLLFSSTIFAQISLGKKTLSGSTTIRVAVEDVNPKLVESLLW